LPDGALQLPPADEVDRNWRPAVALAAAWIAQLSRDERIDASLLATRSDLVAFLSDQPGSRLGTGWRAELVGRHLARLVSGDAALAFEGAGRLVLEARSRQPLTTGDGSAAIAHLDGIDPVEPPDPRDPLDPLDPLDLLEGVDPAPSAG
ncbi:MAG: ribonuclease, partial [Acidimicrobiaceae bacterium]|jgi:hypothetical protein|nr:ribonuclease [Acidimicrobiaceae bacterium]